MAFLEVPLDQGVAIIETEDLPGARPISVLGDSATAAVGAVQSSLASIQDLAEQISSRLGTAKPDGPDEIELTFGIKASAELGALIVAKAQGEANFSVKLKWVRHKSPA
jgi:hypothetical protein